jgi:hypothetical protein
MNIDYFLSGLDDQMRARTPRAASTVANISAFGKSNNGFHCLSPKCCLARPKCVGPRETDSPPPCRQPVKLPVGRLAVIKITAPCDGKDMNRSSSRHTHECRSMESVTGDVNEREGIFWRLDSVWLDCVVLGDLAHQSLVLGHEFTSEFRSEVWVGRFIWRCPALLDRFLQAR